MNVKKGTMLEDFDCIFDGLDIPLKNVFALYPVGHFLTKKIASWIKKNNAVMLDPACVLKEWNIILLSELLEKNNITVLILPTTIYKQLIAKSEEINITNLQVVILTKDFPSQSLTIMHEEKQESCDLYYLSYKEVDFSCEFLKIYDRELGILKSDSWSKYNNAKSDINLNGNVIHLKEIEHTISLHPDVVEAIVTVGKDKDMGTSFLGAYVQPSFNISDKQSIERLEKELKRDLKKFLTTFMVPEAWTFINGFTFTQEGCIEKTSLPAHIFRPNKIISVKGENEIEKKLLRIWCELLQQENVSLDDNFFELGGDSILSIQLVSRARKLGLVISMDQIFDAQTIRELAKIVSFEDSKSIQVAKKISDNNETFDLSPIQSWFLTQNNVNPHHYNQSILLAFEDKLDENILEQSLQEIVQHYPSLRLRFKQYDSTTWIQYYQNYEETLEYKNGICRVEDLSELEEEEAKTFMQDIMNRLHESLNIIDGPMFQACLFQNSSGEGHLFIVAHHLVVDTVSWRILVDGLNTIYVNMTNEGGKKANFVPEQTSYQKWLRAQQALIDDGMLNEEIKYWHNVLKNYQYYFLKETKKHPINNTINEMKEVSLKLPSNKTHALLQLIPKVYKTQVNDLLITALCLTIKDAFDHDTASFMLEGHGREKLSEDMDLSGTVGWFTSNFPVSITLNKGLNLKELIDVVKHVLKSIPNKGVGYGILRYLSKDPENTLKSLNEPELSFNYLGQMEVDLANDALFQLSGESTGRELSVHTKRPTLLEINAQVFRKQFILKIEYNPNVHERVFVKKFAELYLKKLSDIIQYGLSNKSLKYMAKDFPLAKLDQKTFEENFGHEENVEDIYPLSPMQEGLLFQKLYHPNSEAYIVQNLFEVNQPLDIDKFKKAWEILLNRHDILKTGFKWKDLPHSLQFVKKVIFLNWKQYDWRDMPIDQVKDRLNNLLLEDRNTEFDYDKPPLVRLYFIHLPGDQCRFIFTFHHLLIDGWCSSILFNELAQIYGRLIENKTPKLYVQKPFRVFIEWVLNNNIEPAKDFFKTYLYNATLTNISKSLSKQKDSVYKHYEEFENHKYVFSKEETTRLYDFARSQKITISSLFQAGWYKTLQYLTQQDDITFGVVLSGRSAPIDGIEDMVGLFINTLPLRIISDQMTNVKKLLQNVLVQSQQLQKFSHIPLFEVLKWAGQTEENKLFDTIMIFENHYQDPNSQNSESLGLSLLDTYEPTEYPLTLLIIPGDELKIDVTYKKEFFNLLQIKSITYRLVDVLSLVVRDSETLVSDICPTTEQEKSMVLDVWNHTYSEVSEDKLHQVFEKQVTLTPNNVALIEGETKTSFDQLNKLSNQIANMLLEQGIKEKNKVAVSLPRSKNLIASILAIFKIGAIYVPLDTMYPNERKNYILSNSQVQGIITCNASWINFENKLVLPQINLDKVDFTQYPFDNIAGVLAIDDNILTYTSSSTGNPKGVMQTHRAHMNRFEWMWNNYPFSKEDVCCQKTPIGFVDATWETLGPLLKGVSLVILSDEVKHDPMRFIHELNKTRVTRFNTVPSFLSALLEMSENEDIKLDHLKICTVSGEACSMETAQRFVKLYPDTKLLNIYGSTEVCADATCYEYKGEKGLSESLPIGSPINNFNVYIVDGKMKLLSAGVVGEICISGIGVAKGYFNKSNQSKGQFIENPFSTSADYKTLFRTGDFGRFSANGNIEYIGRRDDLVKINGCRVELNEVRFVLSSCEQIKDSAVVLKGEIAGDKRIIAFVVSKEEKLDHAVLRQHIYSFLIEKLPNYMLPSSIIFLDKIPLNTNGKIDYKKLREHDFEVEWSAITTSPTNDLEKALCKMWSDILSTEVNDIELNFFEAGGHSILATKLATRIRRELAYQISIKNIFENPTVKKLAAYLKLNNDTSVEEKAINFRPISRNSRIKIDITKEAEWVD